MKKKSNWWIYIVAAVGVLYIIGRPKSNEDASSITKITDSYSKPLISIKEVAGKNRTDVNKVLGNGKFMTNWKDEKSGCTQCPKYVYKNDSLEIIYIGGKADRITLNNLKDYKFNDSFVEVLGLSPAKPGFANENVKRWYGLDNLKEVMIFNDGSGNVDYALVKTKAD
ncbi:hypothetical protein GCM10028807_17740 [Spirosoma daeguense]